ncbi:enoyl-CoA hydratase/isomerase family protein [Rhizorhapis suberifaciens]|uniref:Enoyl-CoA hydratase/carnithine racemase n=1 Tax=Rhizorhapis suberifaciens TaxID=13656 RepID=A0A840HXU7_9SPHN|nr:enoyl-CoA hydratase/isomerase family protein [Rhizorhapis suberifaciens]MBB4642813.1 enoyl-CoA hydratase/carnithine racemase [Rhizorhapis suberifaciens]
MTQPEIVISEDGGIIHVAFNRPEKYNAISMEMLEGLHDATARLRDRDDLRALLLTANGKYFSAGIDLNSALAPDATITSPSKFRRWYRKGAGSLHGLGDEWEAIEKPIVVAFQGPCLGGALELSLCADFRLATAAARFGLPEIALGALPGSGGTSRLVRLVGPHWARWLVLANRQIEAERALGIGLIHEILGEQDFVEDALAFCKSLCALPPEAFAAGKLAIELAADLDRAQGRNLERMAVSGLFVGAEYQETMRAMQEKLAAKKR